MPKQSELHFKVVFLQSIILLLGLTCTGGISTARGADQALQINYQNNMLSVVARNADLKRILLKIADKTGIYVKFPRDLNTDITLSRSGASLKAVLKNILKGWNYAIVYSGPNRKEAEIAEVLIFSKKQPTSVSRAQARNATRIKNYQRQIDTIRQRMTRVDPDSSRGKNYSRQIQRLEKIIERLEE